MKLISIALSLTLPGVAAIAIALAPMATGGVQGKQKTRFEFGGVTSVVLNSTRGSVQLTAERRGNVTVARTTSTLFSSSKQEAYVRRGVVHLVAHCSSILCASDFKIAVPAGTAVHLLQSTADVKLFGSPGNVSVVNTREGKIELDLLRAPRSLTARTRSGDVRVVLPSGAYSVSTDAQHGVADVRVANDPQSKHRVVARTGNGDVTVKTR